MMKQDEINRERTKVSIPQANVSLKKYSYYNTGGVSHNFHSPNSVKNLIETCTNNKVFWILGAGANTIFGEGIIETPIISTENLNGLRFEDGTIIAESGVTLNQLITATIDHGLAGFEKLSGIPGSVGGATWMNAGAYGSEISDYLTQVTILLDAKVITLSKDDCLFSYRKAKALKESIILEVQWKLPKGDKVELEATRQEILSSRASKQPLNFPSCGSVFKRPEGDYASRLLDAAGLKGYRIGGAMVSEKHAGFIVNYDQATTDDILNLIAYCQKEVLNKFNVSLELEQQVLLK